MKHAIHNLSSSAIWLDCDRHYHLKVEAEAAGVEYNTSSAASERGTDLHTISEFTLPIALAPSSILSSCIAEGVAKAKGGGDLDLGFELNDEDQEQIEIALTATIDLLSAYGCTGVKPEVIVPLSHEPGSNGYVDVVGIANGGETVLVIDYKYGVTGVAPDAPQLKGYGANLIDKIWAGLKNKPNKVVLAIVQPRIFREAIVFESTVKDLKKFQAYVEIVVERQKGGSKRGASSLNTCQWCPFKDACPDYAKLAIDVANTATGGDRGPLVADEIEFIVESKAAITKLLKSCTERVIEDVEAFPNWTRQQVANAAKWNAAIEPGELAHQLRNAGVDNPYVLSTPAKLKDQYPEASEKIVELSLDQGHHVRLKAGAPKAGEPVEAPAKRPVKKAAAKSAAPKKRAAAKKKAAPKKRAAKKKAAPKKKRAKK